MSRVDFKICQCHMSLSLTYPEFQKGVTLMVYLEYQRGAKEAVP